MSKFIYRAKKSPTQIIEDTVIADTKDSAIEKLSSKGYYLLSIDEYLKSQDPSYKLSAIAKKKISFKDITSFTRQLSDLLEGGLTIVKALAILERQSENRRLKEVIADISNFCIDGNPLSSSLARHPDVFSNFFISMVRSGEAGGVLENILRRLADFNEKQFEIQTKVRSALAYPILMAGVGILTIAVLLTFVIPKMAVMFVDLGQNLPLPTLILISLSNFIKSYWWLVLTFIFAAVFILLQAYKTKSGRLTIDGLKMKIAVFGNLIKKVDLARFTRTLATLLDNGVPILESLSVVSETVNNFVIKEEVKKISTHIRKGSSVSDSFSKSPLIPDFLINMVAVGEEGGQVERSLFKIAESYEREADSAIKIMVSLLEPVLILGLGLIVGFIVISMLLPVFEINFFAR